MHIWNTLGTRLTAEGASAPDGEQLISATLTYGGGGSCQGGTLQPLNTTAQGRDTQWQLSLGAVPVFRGIPDGISDADGQLAQVSLLPPHRPRLDGLGEQLGGVQAGPFEALSAALERELGRLPDADIGVRADGGEVAGVPSGGDVYTLDDRAFDIRCIGPAYPDAVTDAVFDPGEGWRKYVYKRFCPPYALRRTSPARADPMIVTRQEPVAVTRWAGAVSAVVEGAVTHSYNNVIDADGVERLYAEQDSTKTDILSDVGMFTFTTPPDTDERRGKKVHVRCPFMVARIAPYPPPAPVKLVPPTPSEGGTSGGGDPIGPPPTNQELATRLEEAERRVSRAEGAIKFVDGNTRTPRGTPKRSELKLLIRLSTVDAEGKETPLNTTGHVFKEQDVGLEQAVEYEVSALPAGATLQLRYELTEQDTGLGITMTFRPIEVTLECEVPNVDAVQMPEGWDKPFRTEPRYSFRLPGWHMPPFRVAGLPGVGEQAVASATVTWNRNECSTTITTGALGYG